MHSLRPTVCGLALALAVAGCGSDGGEAVPDSEVFGKTSTGERESRPTVRGAIDVGGGRKLYMECRGQGSPTVIFLHGSVRKEGDAGGERAGRIPALLEKRHRVCTYDRANVARSDSLPGPLTGTDSAKDLHLLLGAAQVGGPYVLLGASLGGAIADIYAARYPDEVAGMVLLDSTLPAYLDVYERLYPPGSGPQPGEWKQEAERLDRLATFEEAGRIQGRRAEIPVTYIATKSSLPPKITAAIRSAQRKFVDRFSPGRLIVLDVPHDMVPAIPERIAREVRRVAAVRR